MQYTDEEMEFICEEYPSGSYTLQELSDLYGVSQKELGRKIQDELDRKKDELDRKNLHDDVYLNTSKLHDLRDSIRSVCIFLIVFGILLVVVGMVIKIQSENVAEENAEELEENINDVEKLKDMVDKIDTAGEFHYWSGIIISVGIVFVVVGISLSFVVHDPLYFQESLDRQSKK